jgi:hypothetical protein
VPDGAGEEPCGEQRAGRLRRVGWSIVRYVVRKFVDSWLRILMHITNKIVARDVTRLEIT